MSELKIEDLTFSYGNGIDILSNINIKAGNKESIGIIGANGVGKSTLLKILVGLLLDYKGCIELDGIKVVKNNLRAIRQKIGYVFQDSDSQLFMPTVYEDVAFTPINYGFSKAEVEARVIRALKLVGIEDIKDRHIYKLSGGQKKLVSIATILSMEPDVIMLDEPSIALDPRNRRNLIRILNSIDRLKIIASHDLDMVYDTCDRTILLADGCIVADGNTKDILRNKELLEKHGLELPLAYQGFLQVEGENSISIGNNSNRPASISNIKTSLGNVEKTE